MSKPTPVSSMESHAAYKRFSEDSVARAVQRESNPEQCVSQYCPSCEAYHIYDSGKPLTQSSFP